MINLSHYILPKELYERLSKTRIFQLEKAGIFPKRRYFDSESPMRRMPFWLRSEVDSFFSSRVCVGCGKLLNCGKHACPGKYKRFKMGKVPRPVSIMEEITE